MPTYTQLLENKAYNIFPEDDDYMEKLLKVPQMFNSFGEAMDIFLVNHGYTEEVDNIDRKVSFITDHFRQSDIKPPRNIRKWFTEHKRIERKTAFQFCFAFGLTDEGANDFFRRVLLQRGFDCHDVEEIVLFYGLRHGLSYTYISQLISQIPDISQGAINFEADTIYTFEIADQIERLDSADELIAFINSHIEQFAYNNVTAYKYIQSIWNEIASETGLAAMEKQKLYMGFKINGVAQKQTKNKIKANSLWEIYLQILGLSEIDIPKLHADRSLKPILKDNKLLHRLAEESFPDRDVINKILKGQHMSYERVRKVLILLVFYRFWVKTALKNGAYNAAPGDGDRCITQINDFLTDAGYPVLYAGNPYDWIIMYMVLDDFPLVTFREYMCELYHLKQVEWNSK